MRHRQTIVSVERPGVAIRLSDPCGVGNRRSAAAAAATPARGRSAAVRAGGFVPPWAWGARPRAVQSVPECECAGGSRSGDSASGDAPLASTSGGE